MGHGFSLLSACPIERIGYGRFLETAHVGLAQHSLERAVTGGGGFAVGQKLAIIFAEQTALLKVVEQVAGLGVVVAAGAGVKDAVALGGEVLERGQFARPDDPLQPGQAPVGQANDLAFAFVTLFV